MIANVLMYLFCICMFAIALYFHASNQKLLFSIKIMELENKNLNLFIETFFEKNGDDS